MKIVMMVNVILTVLIFAFEIPAVLTTVFRLRCYKVLYLGLSDERPVFGVAGVCTFRSLDTFWLLSYIGPINLV
jgi:hypothetical protein